MLTRHHPHSPCHPRSCRLLRLIKLTRLLRANRIFQHWENSTCYLCCILRTSAAVLRQIVNNYNVTLSMLAILWPLSTHPTSTLHHTRDAYHAYHLVGSRNVHVLLSSRGHSAGEFLSQHEGRTLLTNILAMVLIIARIKCSVPMSLQAHRRPMIVNLNKICGFQYVAIGQRTNGRLAHGTTPPLVVPINRP